VGAITSTTALATRGLWEYPLPRFFDALGWWVWNACFAATNLQFTYGYAILWNGKNSPICEMCNHYDIEEQHVCKGFSQGFLCSVRLRVLEG
jgi:hypothetical protein